MDIIEEIQQRLQKYPRARYEVEGNSIQVLPLSENGFTVGLVAHEKAYTVFFNGWHEQFREKDEAFNCFALGLSEDCRLKEWRRGGMAYKWTVEYQKGEDWLEDSTTGLIFYPFWKPSQVVYLQNNLIPRASSSAT